MITFLAFWFLKIFRLLQWIYPRAVLQHLKSRVCWKETEWTLGRETGGWEMTWVFKSSRIIFSNFHLFAIKLVLSVSRVSLSDKMGRFWNVWKTRCQWAVVSKGDWIATVQQRVREVDICGGTIITLMVEIVFTSPFQWVNNQIYPKQALFNFEFVYVTPLHPTVSVS